MKQYIAVQGLKHRPTHKRIEPGQVVDLSHLTDGEIDLLLQMGAVAPIPEEKPAQRRSDAPKES